MGLLTSWFLSCVVAIAHFPASDAFQHILLFRCLLWVHDNHLKRFLLSCIGLLYGVEYIEYFGSLWCTGVYLIEKMI